MPQATRRLILSLLILAAAACLVLGVTQPIIKLSKLYVWNDVHSLLSIIAALYNKNEVFLAIVLFSFSIVFPAFKLVYLLFAALIPEFDASSNNRFLKRMEWLGKWSMLDVLVLALTIFYVKSSGVADATTLTGVYYFTASVILTMLAYAWIKQPPAPEGFQHAMLRPQDDRRDT